MAKYKYYKGSEIWLNTSTNIIQSVNFPDYKYLDYLNNTEYDYKNH